MIHKYDSFIFDLDGTVYRGDNIIPGAEETINRLKDYGKKIIFISNKTTGTIKEYYTFLKSFGLNIEESEILNSTFVLRNYLKENYLNSTFYAIGEEIFIKEIAEAALNYSEDPTNVELLLVTLARTLTYNKLEIAANALENGARFFAANIDDTCPVSGGEVLDAGSTISALEKRTHRKLELNFGKPSKFMMDEVMKRLSSDKSKTLLIGDRLETDIAMGNKFGIDTALVSTGVRHYSNGNSEIKPTYYLNSVADILKK